MGESRQFPPVDSRLAAVVPTRLADSVAAESVSAAARPGGQANGWHPVALAREAFTGAYQGSRRQLAEVTAWRVEAAVLFVWLAARCAHLAQAAIDVTAGYRSYTLPWLALGLAVACLAESALIAVVMLRAERLTLWSLLADAVFGIAGLLVMSAATTHAAGRTGSLNWMLPYTVGTAAGLCALSVGYGDAARGATARWWWPPSRLLAVQVSAVSVLAAVYLVSVIVPRRLPGDKLVDIWVNTVIYAGVFVAFLAVALLLRRWLAEIGQRNEEAARRARELSQAAQWRALTVDVFGPVLGLFDELAVVGEEVPEPMRAEAGRLILLIDAVRPDAS